MAVADCVGDQVARELPQALMSGGDVLAAMQRGCRFPDLSAVSGCPQTRRDRLVLRGYQTFPVQVAW